MYAIKHLVVALSIGFICQNVISQLIGYTPDVDYPIYNEVPSGLQFSCDNRIPGYYADPEARCQVWHWCANGKKYSFLCPNGTVFNQYVRVCDWFFNVDCPSAPNYYNVNEDLYIIKDNRVRRHNENDNDNEIIFSTPSIPINENRFRSRNSFIPNTDFYTTPTTPVTEVSRGRGRSAYYRNNNNNDYAYTTPIATVTENQRRRNSYYQNGHEFTTQATTPVAQDYNRGRRHSKHVKIVEEVTTKPPRGTRRHSDFRF